MGDSVNSNSSIWKQGKFHIYDDDLHKAVDCLWNNEGEQARALLTPHIGKSPRHALVYAQQLHVL